MKTLMTHAGIFHADDVFATALLSIYFKQLNEPFTIKRVTDVSEADANDPETIVYDIGSGNFDHHQANDDEIDYHFEETVIPKASFGLLWDELGFKVIKQSAKKLGVLPMDDYYEIDHFIDSKLVTAIDAADNGYFLDKFGFNEIIRDFIDENDLEGSFHQAVALAEDVLKRRIKNEFNQQHKAHAILKKTKFITQSIALLPTHGPIRELIYRHPDLELYIYPSLRGGYNVQTVRHYSPYSHTVTIPKEAINLPGVTFVHKDGFLLSAETEEQAINAAKQLYDIV